MKIAITYQLFIHVEGSQFFFQIMYLLLPDEP
jgi:hypothetical protein